MIPFHGIRNAHWPTRFRALFAPLSLLAAATTASADAGACGKVTIAEMTWASAAVAAHVQNIVLREGYGCATDLVPGDTVPTITAMTEKGEPDLAPEVWINTAEEVIQKAVDEGRLVLAGDIFADGATEGWWIPKYLQEKHPELTTLQAVLKRPDLFPDKEEPGKGRFHTCPPGWACQIVNDNLYRAYGLEEAGFTKFNPGSGEGLAAAIARAHDRRQPIFTYYWAPTAVLGKYPMVKLDGMTHDPATWDCVSDPNCADPKPNMYPHAKVVGIASSGFKDRAPEAFAFVARFSWGNDTVNALLAWKDDRQTTAEETARHFLKSYPETWRPWVTEAVAGKVAAAL